MFLGRSESFKWIRRKFSKRNNTNSSANVEHTPAKISKSSNENKENIRDLNEILVVDNTPTIIAPATLSNSTNLATIHYNNAVESTMPTKQTAPIAREEDAEEEFEETPEAKGDKNEINSKDIAEKNQPQAERWYAATNEIMERASASASVGGGSGSGNGNGSSKSSRVRNYLRKCKDRWLAVGLHNQLQEHSNPGHDSKLTMSTTNELDVNQDLRQTIPTATTTTITLRASIITVVSNNPSSSRQDTAEFAATEGGLAQNALENAKKTEDENCVDEDDDDVVDGSYEDIDFGLNSAISRAAKSAVAIQNRTRPNGNCNALAATTAPETHTNNDSYAEREHSPPMVQQPECYRDIENNVEQLVDSSQMESHVAALLDTHLAGIYPIFTATTRAVLIREARDVLVKVYHGCLTSFQQQFLCKFTEIALVLKERHRVGEALIWCQGWPLVTPIGEVILHLGGLDDDQVKPAEIYLCVKAVETNTEPQLYAVWRTPTAHPTAAATATARITARAAVTSQSGSTLKSCRLDYQDHTLYLSTFALEMLSDDLPQLLQNLLLGVENSIERLSLNLLPQIPLTDNNTGSNSSSSTTTTAAGAAGAAGAATAALLAKDDKTHYSAALNGRLQMPSSPKCALRRSELITKNKLLNNKYLLRRLTNRQDSMNSTSSGNSSASGLSTASSDSDSYAKNLNIINTRNTSNNICNSNNAGHQVLATAATSGAATQQADTKSDELNSPALPRFCLGNSFPHIDSDEENADDKRNSLADDQLESEIIAPNSITDLPEKLLLSGIYLPGTCDLKGNPLVTVDAESVLAAGLNCYEIATLLLYYSTIPEGCEQRKTHLNGKTLSNATQKSQLKSTETSSVPPPAAQSLNQLTTPQNAATTTTTAAAAAAAIDNTQLSAKTMATTSAQATCTSSASLNDNNNIVCMHSSQQQHLQQSEHLETQHEKTTFTILIVIEKSQHLCVIDLISQSLKLLTRHIAYCELLAICLDANLGPTSSQKENGAAGVAISSSEHTAAATPTLIAVATATATDSNGNHCSNKSSTNHAIKFISTDAVTASVAPSQTPSGRLGGLHHHDARKWREFFLQYEPFYNQCLGAAQRLVAALNDIRHADLQGLPTRRQLYAQHRALSRALMDSELHNLRKRSSATMLRLQELAKNINCHSHNGSSSISCSGGSGYVGSQKITTSSAGTSAYSRNRIMGSGSSGYSFNYQSNQNQSQISHNISATPATKSLLASPATIAATKPAATAALLPSQATTITNAIIKSSIYPANLQTSTSTSSRVSTNYTNNTNLIHSINNNNNSNNSNNNSHNNGSATTTTIGNSDVAIRLQKVTLLFNEIDRAAKRLEQLTEQRREHLRELTRQRALEDEINEVTSWLTSDGSESLQRFLNVELDLDTPMKEIEREFEKYYFISMKHLAKGRDLHLAAASMETLKESSLNLKKALDSFAEKLEIGRERIEGATRLYHLMHIHIMDESLQSEMERLAEQYGRKGLLEKYLEKENDRLKPRLEGFNLHVTYNTLPKSMTQMATSTPDTNKMRAMNHRSSYGTCSFDSPTCHCWRDSRNLDDMDQMLDNDDEEGRSKIADSGVGECQRCEGNPKFTRACSCQSLNEESENLYEKNGDELDDECFEQPSKHYINVHSPWEANKHLQSYASTFELPELAELSCLDPKIQKTLLLIMREMIGTERDYVRSLYYVIDNYIDELLRDDIPQSLRGQRNVIFGNIEKIFEFHNNHFLAELERYEHNPLSVGAAFLQMESKFYLYALYNKNKPKSDTLMSEYGTAFFKSKQLELNDKMDLASYLLKPVQRMGKYALLLQQLVKACSSVQGSALQEIAADVEELQRAEEMVKFQLRHGNDLLAMDSLRDCDVNVKEQGRLLRQNEFLVWQGRGGKKTLRQIFLFEELVLFSKARRFPDHKNLDIYIYKNSIKTSDIGLTAHVGDSPTKFEIWFRKRKPEDTYTLQCMSEDIKNAWTEEISKLLWQQAKRNREIRLAEMSSMGIGSKPCLDIRPSNNQINDRSITISQLGKAPKLRHSFVGLHADQTKTARRPNSLISESSLSSGTSSSSLSKSSTSSSSSSAHNHHNHLHNQQSQYQPLQLQLQHPPNQALELITECQTLALESSNDSYNRPQQLMTNTMSSGFSSQSSAGGTISSRQRNHHKRSTTIVSQLSMESGIISDICMTPDQDNNDVLTTWPSHSADAIAGVQKCALKCHSSNTLGKKVEPQKTHHHHHTQHQQLKEFKTEET